MTDNRSTTARPSVICAPRSNSFPIKQECMEVDDDQPQDLSIRSKVKREISLPTNLSLHGNSTSVSALRSNHPEVTTDVVTIKKRDTESPTTPLSPMERISLSILRDVPSTSGTTPATSSSPGPSPAPSAPTRRRGRPRLPDSHVPGGDGHGDSKIFQKRLYAREYRERIKNQLDAKQDLQRKLNEIRAQNELLQKEIDFLKQQNMAFKQQQQSIFFPENLKNLSN